MENLLSKEEMNAVINGDHGNVFAVLGIHRDKGSKEVFIRTYQPNTKSVELLKKDGSSLGKMSKLDNRGFYQINLGQIENFAYKLAQNNIIVISGLARGIDSYAHLGALKESNSTIAVTRMRTRSSLPKRKQSDF